MSHRNKSRKRGWSDKDVAELRSIWGTMRDADVAKALGKTVSGVRLKATSLNLRAEKGKRAGTRSGEVTYPWSKMEEMLLLKNVGHSSIFELMELLPSRTRAAIESRCRRLGFSPTQGTFTRCGIERETGYDWRQIKRARDALGQSWKRYGVRKYIISEEQVDEIINWLKNETKKWSKQWDLNECKQCGANGTSERERHSGDGLCKKCLSGDTKIFVKNKGVVSLKSLHGQGDFDVWTGSEWATTSVICQGERDVISLLISNGTVLQCTPDHKILSGTEMVEAANMLGRTFHRDDLTCVDISLLGRVPVYDLVNVGSEARFVANGVIVSNCWDSRRYTRSMSLSALSSGRALELTDATWSEINSEKNA